MGQTVAMEEICNFWDITHGQTRTDLDPKKEKNWTQTMHVHEHRRFPKEPEALRPMLAWRALSMLITLEALRAGPGQLDCCCSFLEVSDVQP